MALLKKESFTHNSEIPSLSVWSGFGRCRTGFPSFPNLGGFMKYAVFESLLDAQIYRKNRGGWIFVTEWCEAFWFCLDYKPTDIMHHRLTKGLSGRLI